MRWKKDWGKYDWGQILTNYEHVLMISWVSAAL